MLVFMILFFLIAIFMTIYLKFPQFRVFKNIKKCNNIKTKQTFYLSLATNLGVGNLIGVSTAIFLGGPGVVFWMALFAFFSSSLAFIENYYAIDSQVKTKEGTFAGTSYTIVKYSNNKNRHLIGLIFAFFLVLSNTIFFPPIQINAIVNIVSDKYQIILGSFVVVVILLTIMGGIKRILKITDFFVPIVSILYFIIVLLGILLNYQQLDNILKNILDSAFNIKSIGVSAFFSMIKISISKSLFSNEAGLGTIPSLTGVSDKEEKEVVCYYQVLGVIIDTVVLCTMTGIFILCYGEGYNGNIEYLLSNCFKDFLGNFGLVIYDIFIVFFGFTSVLGLYFLGENNIMFISMYSKLSFKTIKFIYQIVFMIGIVIGIIGTFSNIMWLLDIGILIIGTLNILILIKIENRQKLLKNIHKIT